MTKRMKRFLSAMLCLCMLAQNAPVMAFATAEDNLCPHHTEHTTECHYQEGVHECHFQCDECQAAPAEEASEETTVPETSEAEPEIAEAADLAEVVTEAVCVCESDEADYHAPFCPLYAAPENPQCYCVEPCADGAVNEWCDVCFFDAAAEDEIKFNIA